MTAEEFKREMEALALKIDKELAEELASKDQWGHALAVDRIIHDDLKKRPKGGVRLLASLTFHFAPVRFAYEEEKV